MTIQLWCLLGGVILPYVWAGVSVPFRNAQLGNVDLEQPRVQAEKLTDGGARAWGAQMNAWEALIVFGIANFAAYTQQVDPNGYWSIACLIWLVARALHGLFYVKGLAVARVAAFVTATAMSLSIMVAALMA